ncbi:hypothetical protein A4G26_19530 [Mycobacterium kansasii]|uniref:Uncharacterized protein n=1 Tax=Mycobacterium innocens TaxID=2341083 RepID=A0A498Q5K9_9MYCO|nr:MULTISPECIES: hypothetical protein [Mycobacterium]KZS52843.1 hypothetical protein A4G26_19530 [Mycobacterium kansasii]VBA40647.1 hypothetical protein LAUMK13_03162 [Mycobacterium innocens]
MDDEDDEKGDDEVAVLADGPKAGSERALELFDDLDECPFFVRRAAAWCGTSDPIVETTSDSLLVMI